MKKRFTAILTALLCMCAPMTAFAEDAIVEVNPAKPIYDTKGNIIEYTLPEVTIKTDKFTYTNNTKVSYREGFFLESDIASPDLMVVGEKWIDGEYWGPIVTPINDVDRGIGAIYPEILDTQLGGQREFNIGDLIVAHGGLCGGSGSYEGSTLDPETRLDIDGKMEVIGNGVDIFGEEFARVIRLQMVLDQEMLNKWIEADRFDKFAYDIVKGDVNVDEEISVLDCLAINRNLLTGEPLCDYAKLAGDINENGAIDAVDSLSILKETIGLTENFE